MLHNVIHTLVQSITYLLFKTNHCIKRLKKFGEIILSWCSSICKESLPYFHFNWRKIKAAVHQEIFMHHYLVSVLNKWALLMHLNTCNGEILLWFLTASHFCKHFNNIHNLIFLLPSLPTVKLYYIKYIWPLY